MASTALPMSGFASNLRPKTQDELMGIVLDNEDPLFLRRIRVEIPNVITLANSYVISDAGEFIAPIEDPEQLPWIRPENRSFEGAAPEVESMHIPILESMVYVNFKNGNPLDGTYTGAPMGDETKSEVFDEDYPESYGNIDVNGNTNHTNKAKGFYKYTHESLSYLLYERNGDVTRYVVKDQITNVDNDRKTTIKGNSTTNIDKNQTVKTKGDSFHHVDGKIDFSAGKTLTGRVDGNVTYTFKGKASWTISKDLSFVVGGAASIETAKDLKLKVAGTTDVECKQTNMSGNLDVAGNVKVGTGASGSFTSVEGFVVTVKDGIVIGIV